MNSSGEKINGERFHSSAQIDNLVIVTDNQKEVEIILDFFKPPYSWLFHSTTRESIATILESGKLKNGVSAEFETTSPTSKSLNRSAFGPGAGIQISWNMDSTEIVFADNGATFGFICPTKNALELCPGTKLSPTRMSARNELQLLDSRFNVGDEIRSQSGGFRNLIRKSFSASIGAQPGNPLYGKFDWVLPQIDLSELIFVCDKKSWHEWVRAYLETVKNLPKGILLVDSPDIDSSFLEKTGNSDSLGVQIKAQLKSIGVPDSLLSYSMVSPEHTDSDSADAIASNQVPDDTMHKAFFDSSDAQVPRAFVLKDGEIQVIQQK